MSGWIAGGRAFQADSFSGVERHGLGVFKEQQVNHL